MFYVQKIERPLFSSGERETEVVFLAFQLQGNAKNLNGNVRGYESLKEAAKDLGIAIVDIEYDHTPTAEEVAFELAFAGSEREFAAAELEKRKDAFRKKHKTKPVEATVVANGATDVVTG